MLFFLAMTTWPGATLVNDVEPFILGLPFNLFFIAALITIAIALLTALYFSEQRPKTK
ncbi:MAG: DUF3311 domain-containing protein [Pseudomonadota bacterium]